MTHPALFSLQDNIDALSAALELEGLTIIERQILKDMRDDLQGSADIDTFRDVIDLANKQAARGNH